MTFMRVNTLSFSTKQKTPALYAAGVFYLVFLTHHIFTILTQRETIKPNLHISLGDDRKKIDLLAENHRNLFHDTKDISFEYRHYGWNSRLFFIRCRRRHNGFCLWR